MARASSYHSGVVTGAGRVTALSHLGEGRPEPPPLLEVMWNSLVESFIKAHHGDGGPLRVEPSKTGPESLLLGERPRTLR
jgi:hypothetical protein